MFLRRPELRSWSQRICSVGFLKGQLFIYSLLPSSLARAEYPVYGEDDECNSAFKHQIYSIYMQFGANHAGDSRHSMADFKM